MPIRKPQFFLIGAPKCGTTSMDEWLKAHPGIFMPLKEVHYFNTDHPNRWMTSLQDYQALFEGVTDRHIMVGETSVRYLSSHEAVANILRYNEEAIFLVMVRNPVEMAYSFYYQQCFAGVEDVADFETAWNLQAQRKAGWQIPRHCVNITRLLYGDICRLGQQVQRLYQQVPSERVHVVVFDDLKADPGNVYRSVLKFLHVPDDHRQVFGICNPAKVCIFHPLNRWLSWLERLLPLGHLKKAVGISKEFGIVNSVRELNQKVQPRPPLSPHMRRTLTQYFYDDVRLLERLIERDLTHWTVWGGGGGSQQAGVVLVRENLAGQHGRRSHLRPAMHGLREKTCDDGITRLGSDTKEPCWWRCS